MSELIRKIISTSIINAYQANSKDIYDSKLIGGFPNEEARSHFFVFAFVELPNLLIAYLSFKYDFACQTVPCLSE